MAKVFINGAGGFVGSHIVEAFCREGHQVTASDIQGADFSIPKKAGAKIVPADITDPKAVKEVVAGHDVVVNVAGIFDLAAPRELMEKVNVQGVRNMCEASLDNGVSRFVQLSTVGVYGKPEKTPCSEPDPKNPVDNYGQTKWLGEQEAFRYHREKGLPVTALRPTLIYGPRSQYGQAMYIGLFSLMKHRGRKGIAMVDSGPLTHHAHVEDAGRAVLLLAEKDQAVGRAFNLADDAPITFREMMEHTLEPLGMKIGKTIAYKPWLWQSLIKTARVLIPGNLSPLQNLVSRRWQEVVSECSLTGDLRLRLDVNWMLYCQDDMVYDISQIKELGLKLAYPTFKEGVAQTIEWYRDNRWIP